jgi:hypothetical protein
MWPQLAHSHITMPAFLKHFFGFHIMQELAVAFFVHFFNFGYGAEQVG